MGYASIGCELTLPAIAVELKNKGATEPHESSVRARPNTLISFRMDGIKAHP